MKYSKLMSAHTRGKQLVKEAKEKNKQITEDSIFNYMSKTEAIHYLIGMNDDEMEHDEIDWVLTQIFYHFDISLFDIFQQANIYVPCTTCDGVGIKVSHDIESCPICKGRRVLPRINTKPTMVEYTYIWIAGQPTCFIDADILTRDDYAGASTYLDINRQSVVVNTETNKLEYVGTLDSIYNFLSIDCKYYISIPLLTDGKFRVLSLEKYNQEYNLLNKKEFDHIKQNVISMSTMMYLYSASYDVDKLLYYYMQKFPTVDSMIENMMYHINLMEHQDYVINGNTLLTILRKIIDDFKIIGIQLTEHQAMTVYTSLEAMLEDDVITVIQAYNTIGIYIIEYIIISAEYANLTEDKSE